MTEPQVWTLIGVFAAAIGMVGIVLTGFNRTLTASISRLEQRIDGLDAKMDARFEAMDAKFSSKFEVLDRDIQALSRHVFGTDPR